MVSVESANLKVNFPVFIEPTPDSHTAIVTNKIREQAQKPPGGDRYISDFYSAFLDTLEHNNVARMLIEEVGQFRTITPELHVNLLFRSFQSHLMRFDNYPQMFATELDWMKAINNAIQDERVCERIKKTLLEKETTTTVYQRYAGEKAIMAYLASDRPVVMADVGCGGNYGLPGIELEEPFKNINDRTSTKLIETHLRESLEISQGVGIDINDPYDPEEIVWRHSCGLYPTELEKGMLQELEDFEERIKASKRVAFHHGNLLNLSNEHELPFDGCDFVLMNTMMYQLEISKQKSALQQARTLLKPHGVLFIQDFATIDPSDDGRLNFRGVSWGDFGSYRLFLTNKQPGSKIYEALRWNNGRCTIVEEGLDFSRIGELHLTDK